MNKVEFPKWKYHATEAPALVNTEEEEKALGEGWHNSPADITKEPEKKSESKKTEGK